MPADHAHGPGETSVSDQSFTCPTAVIAMNSPQPALTSTPAGNIMIVVRVGSPSPVGLYADPLEAANDGLLPTPLDGLPAPVLQAVQTHPRMRIPLAVALAAMLWILGTILLLTLAMAYQLMA